MTANVFQMSGDVEIKKDAATQDVLNLIKYLVEDGFEYTEDPEYPYTVAFDDMVGNYATTNKNNETVIHTPISGSGYFCFEEYITTFFDQMATFEDGALIQNTLLLLKTLTNQNTELKFCYKEVDLESNTCSDIVINITSDLNHTFNIHTHVESSNSHPTTMQDLKYIDYPYPNIDYFYEKYELDDHYTLYYPDEKDYEEWLKSITPKYYNPKTDQFENKDGKVLAYNPEDEYFVISN